MIKEIVSSKKQEQRAIQKRSGWRRNKELFEIKI